MKGNKSLQIIKLGGDVITDKKRPFSIQKEICSHLVDDISKFYEENKGNLIIVHGGGSFGHPLAKQYKIQQGVDASVPNQINGLIDTHQKMLELNSIIVKYLREKNLPILSVAPLDVFLFNNGELKFYGADLIETLLDLGIIPLLYGDILIHRPSNFSILSGDTIIQFLCDKIKKYQINQVIFTISEDGLILKHDNKENLNLVPKILNYSEIKENLYHSVDKGKGKIDVTGGIQGKLIEVEKIIANKIPVRLLNGLKPGELYKGLIGMDNTGTIVIPDRGKVFKR
jgi:isopentenyl phosphate kinase